MRSKPYAPGKRALLAERPGEVLAFIQELPQNQIRTIALKLPPVAHGFRRGQPAELQQRIKQFISGIRRWTDKQWDLFQEIWLLWIRCHPELDTVLANYDNKADFEGEAPTPANSPRDIGCFERLAQASQEWTLSREMIERFYTFGYFPPDERIEQTIRLARSEAELRLPRDLAALKRQVQELIEDAQSTAAQVETWKKDRAKLDTLDAGIGAIKRQVDVASHTLSSAQQWQESLEQRFDRMEVEARKVGSEALWHSGKVRSDLEDQIAEIRQVQDDLHQALQTLTAQIVELNERWTAPQIGCVDLPSGPQQAHDDSCGTRTAPAETVGWPVVYPTLASERLSSCTTDLRLETAEAARNVLSENFRAIGMQSQAAQALSVEVLAAALAGQAVFFRGALASIVVDVCARTLADGSSFRLQIPVGLLDERPFGAVLEDLLRETTRSDRAITLILEGINLSAPEVYASRLRRLIIERLLGLDRTCVGLFVLGTVVDGVGTLPVSPQFSEIGPIFDLDCLVWRNRWPKREIAGGWIHRKNWEAWVDSDREVPTDWDDIWRDTMRLAGPATPLWRHSIYTAFARLSMLADNDVVPTAFQSLVYGWLLPRVIASGGDLGETRELLPPGVRDGDRPDMRIARLLGERSEGDEP